MTAAAASTRYGREAARGGLTRRGCRSGRREVTANSGASASVFPWLTTSGRPAGVVEAACGSRIACNGQLRSCLTLSGPLHATDPGRARNGGGGWH